MNWLRDNIVKIIAIIVIAIVIIFFVVSCGGSGNGNGEYESADGYVEIENRLQNAAFNYVKKKQSILPKTTDKVVTIKSSTLVSNGFIKELRAVDNSSTKCSGYVEIVKREDKKNDYRYTPFIKCGKYYETRTISDYLIDENEVVESGQGLYIDHSDEEGNNSYIFKGENPNNVILLGERRYRILGIDSDNNVKVISTVRYPERFLWDDRYNSSVDKYYGINDYSKSRIKDSLNDMYTNSSTEYDNAFFSDQEKSYMESKEFCVGKRKLDDFGINSDKECKVTSKQKVGIITLSEYYKVSASEECNQIGKLACNNYNFLFDYDFNSFATLTAIEDNTYSFYNISDGEIEEMRCSRQGVIYPVFYLKNYLIYKSGTGTMNDPYVIR